MVDNVNPNSQFHPYQPMTETPQADKLSGGLSGMLKRAGIDSSMFGNMRGTDMRKSVDKVRDYARRNPSAVLGGLAAAVIGLGLLRGRR